MAANFRIHIHRQKTDLNLELTGDFDGSSAFELIDVLRAYNGKAKKMVIDTGGISSVHPFGLRVFQKHCSINSLSPDLTFIGRHGNTLAFKERHSL